MFQLEQAQQIAKKTPEELQEEIICFLNYVKKLCKMYRYTNYIGNMDKTICRFDVLPNQKNNVKGKSSICIVNTGCKKRGFTISKGVGYFQDFTINKTMDYHFNIRLMILSLALSFPFLLFLYICKLFKK